MPALLFFIELVVIGGVHKIRAAAVTPDAVSHWTKVLVLVWS